MVKDCITVGTTPKGSDPGDNGGAGKWNKCDHITIDGLDSYKQHRHRLVVRLQQHRISSFQNCKIHDNHGLKHDYEASA